MKVLDELCDVLEDELEDIVKSARSNGMSPDELANAYKAVDIVKDITTIKAMKEAEYEGYSKEGYSNRMMPYYASYDDDYSMARGGRGGNSRNNGRSNRGYSRDDEKENLMREMENMKRQLEQMQR